jgi:hypothetical protein
VRPELAGKEVPMSASALFLPEGGSYYTQHSARIKGKRIPRDKRAATWETWHALLDLRHKRRLQLGESITNRVLAQYMGRGLRFVQKGLKVLEDLEFIKRIRGRGRRRIIILERFRGRKHPEVRPKTESRPKPQPKPEPKPTRPEPAPDPGKVSPRPPESLPAIAALARDIAKTPGPPPPSEDQAEAEATLAALKARRQDMPYDPDKARRIRLYGLDTKDPGYCAFKAQLEAQDQATPAADSQVPSPKSSAEEQKARLDAFLKNRAGQADPDAPAAHPRE